VLRGGLGLTSASRSSTSLLIVSGPGSEDKIVDQPRKQWATGAGAFPRPRQDLIDYRAHTYDMGRVQRRLNTYPQFRAEIDGLGIYLRVHSRYPDALPMRGLVR
jgi:hypothetical protein